MARRRRRRRSTRGLGWTCRSPGCVDNHIFRTASGRTAKVRVPKACAIVQRAGGGKKIRKGCKISRSGAYCDAGLSLPKKVRARKPGTKRKFYTVSCR